VFFARRLLPPPTLTATALRGAEEKRFQEEEEEEEEEDELVEQKEEHALGVAIVRILPFSVLNIMRLKTGLSPLRKVSRAVSPLSLSLSRFATTATTNLPFFVWPVEKRSVQWNEGERDLSNRIFFFFVCFFFSFFFVSLLFTSLDSTGSHFFVLFFQRSLHTHTHTQKKSFLTTARARL